MPDYNFTLTVPAATKPEAPMEIELNLTKGVIASGQLFFPPGCHGLVHIIIADGRGQLYPANAEDTYHYDDAIIPLVGRYVLDTAPYKLFMRGWSPGANYDHTIQLSLAVLPEEEVTPWRIIQDFMLILKRLMGLK